MVRPIFVLAVLAGMGLALLALAGAPASALGATKSVAIVGPDICPEPPSPNQCRFDKSSETIAIGDKVKWTNQGPGAHTVTDKAEPKYFNSGTLGDNDVFEFLFERVGTFSYRCMLHTEAGMPPGTITVTNTKPRVDLTSHKDGASVSGSSRVSGTASDPDGTYTPISKVEVNINGGGWEEASADASDWSTWHHDFTASGAHGSAVQVKARSTDSLGSVSTERTLNLVVNAAPQVSFTLTPVAPTSADTVQFTSTVVDDDVINMEYSWDFGDGGAATTANATHSFAKGSYTVKLEVKDHEGLDANTTKPLTVANSAPRANFSVEPADPAIDEAVTFTDRTEDLDGDATAWAWDFGDGGTSAQRNATHTYAAAGTYTVKLTVTDAEGASKATQKLLEVVEFATQRPVAQLTASSSRGVAPFTVTFLLDGSDPDGSISNWTMDFGDGSALLTGPGSLFQGSASHSQAHTYTRNGTFEAVLTVRDNLGAAGTNRTTIVVDAPPNRPPQPRFEVAPTATPRKGQTLSFADASTDPDVGDEVVSWDWAFGDGARSCCDQPRVTHAYARVGRFVATLTVADTLGDKASLPLTIDVQGEAPRVLLAVNATQGRAPFPVSFSLDARDSDGRIERWELDFGDGSPARSAEGAPANASVQHVYEDDGAFSAQLDAFDDDGLSGRSVVTIVISPRAAGPLPLPPSAISVSPTGSRFTYKFAATTTMPGDITYQWAFGDGRTATGREVEYSYEQAGTYTVTLTLQGPGGPVARASLGIGVGEDASTVREKVRSEVASGVVRVAWTPDSRAAGYQVWKSEGGGAFAEVPESPVTSVTHYDDQDVEDGVQYAYQVTFFSADGTGRLQRLSQLGSTEAFRRLGQVTATGLVDSDGDGVGDTRDAFPQDSTRSVAPTNPWLLPLVGLGVLAAAGLAAWKYREPLQARLTGGPEPGALVTVPGLQPQHAFVLQKAGIRDARMLAVADPADLARRTVLPRHVLDQWVATAQLMQLPGIPPKAADQLARAGIRGPWDLARADPAALSQRLDEVPLAKAQRWVRTARRATSAG